MASNCVSDWSAPAPFLTAFSMVSRGMLAALPSSIARRSTALNFGSGPPARAATMMARASFDQIFPRLASTAALRCLMFFQALCPAMVLDCSERGSG